jgi:hypothetical protein
MPYKNKESQRAYYLKNNERHRELARLNYLKNREIFIAKVKKRYAEKREMILNKKKESYIKNKEEHNKRVKIWREKNKDKVKAIKKKYRINHREKLRESSRIYTNLHRKIYKERRKIRRANKDLAKNEKLKDRHKITLEDFKKLLESQFNKCGICGTDFNDTEPCVDHDHYNKTKIHIIRGLLCHSCNSGIGGFKDNSDLLKKALLWLKKDFPEISKEPLKYDFKYQYKRRNLNKFGINIVQYHNLIVMQNYRCGICEKEFTDKGPYGPCIDHDHKGEHRIRGILCGRCNISLGLLKDDPAIVNNAINWLTKDTKCES